MKTISPRRGFTLIELLIVVIIIGIIAAIALPRFTDVKNKAYISTLASDVRTLAGAQEIQLHDDVPAKAQYAECSNLSVTRGADSACTQGTLNFSPSPDVRVSTEYMKDSVSGWDANARHSKLGDTLKNRCFNAGDTSGVVGARLGGIDLSKPVGTQYACGVKY